MRNRPAPFKIFSNVIDSFFESAQELVVREPFVETLIDRLEDDIDLNPETSL